VRDCPFPIRKVEALGNVTFGRIKCSLINRAEEYIKIVAKFKHLITFYIRSMLKRNVSGIGSPGDVNYF
jgi:hypothetical protein